MLYTTCPLGPLAESLSGKKFNHLTALYPVATGEKSKSKQWLCRCECGNQVVTTALSLKRGDKKSCGCAWRTSVGGLSGEMVSHFRNGARTRGIEFNVSADFLWKLFLSQDQKCALSGIPLTLGKTIKDSTASIDRIDSSGGYTESNVQWVHKTVNMMKWKLSVDEFVDIAGKVYEFCSCKYKAGNNACAKSPQNVA